MEARVQELLGKSNARIVESLQDQLHDAEGRIDEAARSKEEMAVSMHALQQNALRLRTDLTEAQYNVALLEKQGIETTSREESTKKKLREALSRTKELESDLLEAKSKVDAKHEENILLQQVCADLKKALKTQELADSATQQHIRFLESQMKQEKLACKEATARLQNSKNETKKLQKRLEAQEHETKLAQTHIEKVAQELKILSASKAVIQAQWQASLLAMSKRDEILQGAEKKRDEAEARLESELKSVGSTTQTVTALRAQVKALEEELALAQKQIATQADQISSQSKQITSTTSSLERERLKGRKMVAVLNDSQKAAISGEARAQRQEQEHQSLLAQVSALKNKLEATERDLGIAQEQCRVISAESAARGAKDANTSERNESELKNRLSRQTVEMQELREEVARREALAASAEAREREASLRADKLTKERQHLLAANLRLQHRLNKAVEEQQCKGGQNVPVQENLAAPSKSREESAEALRIKSYEDRVSKAQSLIERQSEEIAVLRAEWSRAEGEMVKARQIHAKLKVPAERRDVELALVRHFNSTARAEANAQRAVVDRQAVQLDIARAEQRKTNAAQAKLADKNTHLSLALVNNSFWYEAANANLETQVDELKVSLVDSRKAKQAAAKLQLDTESKLALAQHRCRLLDARLEDGRTKLQDAKDHIQRLESKNTKLARENGKLKQAVQKLEQAQLLAERALVNAGNRNIKNNNINNKMRKKSSNQDTRVADDEDARKVQANLYHAETELAQGREHLVKLANQVEEERERAQRLGQAYMEREELAGKLAAQLQESRTSLLQVQASHARAISVAAALEAQLTERTKFINYEPRPGTTPTVNLQSALAKILQPQRPESRQAPISL